MLVVSITWVCSVNAGVLETLISSTIFLDSLHHQGSANSFSKHMTSSSSDVILHK